MAFENRDPSLDIANNGDINLVPLDRITEQQLIDEIVQDQDSTGSVSKLIAEMNYVQQEIDDVIEQIEEIKEPNAEEDHEHRSTRSTRGQQLTKIYEEEYQMLNLDNHDNTRREVNLMLELEVTKHIIGIIFTQYLLKTGMAKFKAAGKDTLKKELTQVHDMDVFVPFPVSHLLEDQKWKALSMVTFIKQRQDNRVKG